MGRRVEVEKGYDQPQCVEEDSRLVKPSPQTHRRHRLLASIPSTFACRPRRVKVVNVGFHDATGFLAWVAELALPTGKPGLFDLVLRVGGGLLLVFFNEDGDGKHVILGGNVAGPTTGVADEVWVPLASILIGADKMPARMVCRWGTRATIATAGGEGVRLESAASMVVTSIAAVARRWVVMSSSVDPKNMQGALDGDVKRPSCLATQAVGLREDRPGAELGSFVELVRETHDA